MFLLTDIKRVFAGARTTLSEDYGRQVMHGQVIRIYDTSTFSVWVLGESKTASCYESLPDAVPVEGDIICFEWSHDGRHACKPVRSELSELSNAESRDLILSKSKGDDRHRGTGRGSRN